MWRFFQTRLVANGAVSAEDEVPEHNVLAKVALGLTMVEIMRPNVEHIRQADVIAGVVQGSKGAADEDEHKERQRVNAGEEAGESPDREQMKVLPRDVLERMSVDRVLVSTEWAHLPMVVLVDERINGLPVQKPVKQRVRKVVYDEEKREVDRPPRDGGEHIRDV